MVVNNGKSFLILLGIIAMGVIGFVILFYLHIGPLIIDKASTEPPLVQEMSVRELEQILSTYIELYEGNMLTYNEYRKAAVNDNKEKADQYLIEARFAEKLYEETYNKHRELAEMLPADMFPEKLE